MHGADVSQETRALRERIDELEEANRQLKDVLTPPLRFPAEWRLTPAEARGLAALYASPNGYRTKEALLIAVRQHDDTDVEVVDVHLMNLRRKLKGRGLAGADITIETIPKAGTLWLPPASRAAIQHALTAAGLSLPLPRA